MSFQSPPTPSTARRPSHGFSASPSPDPSSPSKSAAAASPSKLVPPLPQSETVQLALSATPFQTKNTRRDLTTSYRAFRQAWEAIEKTTILQSSARRLGERAAAVLLVTTEKLSAYEPTDEREKILAKRVPYEFDPQANPHETKFRLQSVMIDVQVAMSALSSNTQDRQQLLVRELASTVQAIAKLNNSLAGLIELYDLFISTESWKTEDENDLQADYSVLPRLFQLAFALRGPLYTAFLKENPAPPGEIISIAKRRDDYLVYCLELNPLLKPDPATPITPKKRWTPTILPDGTPNSSISTTPSAFNRLGMGKPSVLVTPSSRRTASTSSVLSTPPPAPGDGLRRSHTTHEPKRRSMTTSGSTVFEIITDSPLAEKFPRPHSPLPGPETPPGSKSSSPRDDIPVKKEDLNAASKLPTPDPTPPTTPTKCIPDFLPRPISPSISTPSLTESPSVGDPEGTSGQTDEPATPIDVQPNTPHSGASSEMSSLLEELDINLEFLSNGEDVMDKLDFDPLLSPVARSRSASSDEDEEDETELVPATLAAPLRIPRRVPSSPSLPVIPENELWDHDPIPVVEIRPATPIDSGTPAIVTPPKGLKLLTLDGGGIRGLPLLYALKSKLPKNSPPPWQVFDLITGIGTGALVALLIGRLRLSIDDAIGIYISIARNSFMAKEMSRKKSRWGRIFGGGAAVETSENAQASPGTREFGLEESIQQFLPEALMSDDFRSGKGCKTAVLAYEKSSYGTDGAPVWFRSYGKSDITSIRTVLRATMASSGFFRPYRASSHRAAFITSPESLNPTNLTLDEAQRIVETSNDDLDSDTAPQLDIEQLLSIGVGQIPQGIRLTSKTKTRSLKTVTRIVEDNRVAHEAVLRRAKREGWSGKLERVDVELLPRDDKGVDEYVYHILLRDAIDKQIREVEKVGGAQLRKATAMVSDSDFAPAVPTSNGSSKGKGSLGRSGFSFRKTSRGPPVPNESSAGIRRSVSLTNLRSESKPLYLQRDGSTASLDTEIHGDEWRMHAVV